MGVQDTIPALDDELLTTDEAAAILKVTPNALRVRRSRGLPGPAFVKLPGVVKGHIRDTRRVRYLKKAVLAWSVSEGLRYQTEPAA